MMNLFANTSGLKKRAGSLLLKAGCLSLAFAFTGCAMKKNNFSSDENMIPLRGGEMPAEVWTDAAEAVAAGGARPSYRKSYSLWFPGISKDAVTRVDSAQGMAYSDASDSYGLFLYPYLPLVFNRSAHLYRNGQTEPVGSASYSWNPFWFSSNIDGEMKEVLRLKTSPSWLAWFYSSLTWESQANPDTEHQRITTSLAPLGPVYYEYADPGATSGYFFSPLFVGGVGSLVWSDFETKQKDPTHPDYTWQEGHGPFAVYYHYKMRDVQEATESRPEREIIEDRLLLLGGLLWDDQTHKTLDGEVVYDSNGPVLGIIGWGTKEGAAMIRLLWFDVVYGDAPEKAASEE